MKIAAFPKCYLEEIVSRRTMSIFEWIDMAQQLDVEGLELYDRFLTSLDSQYLAQVSDAIHEAGFEMPMMCCSPDFTNPDPDYRKKELEKESEMIRITRQLGASGATCRVLTGQRYPQISIEQGLEWVLDSINQLIPVAKEFNIILALENHYKDGFWRYPEFAQKKDVFLKVLAAIPECEYFGVQYDPSNAIVAGDDPIELLRDVADRVLSMHASDRHLVEGTTLDELRQSDGTLGYSPNLRHGVIGQGLNDYDAIFSILAQVGYDGWVSIENGMNGIEEMQASVAFLKRMQETHYPT